MEHRQLSLSEDFMEQTATTADGTVTNLTTPPSDVLKYILLMVHGLRFALRVQNQKSNSTLQL